MKISQWEGDDGYSSYSAAVDRGESVTVKLDGQVVENWFYADDNIGDGRGIVAFPKKNDDGSLWLDEYGFMLTIKKAGTIEITVG